MKGKTKITCFICGHRTLPGRCDWDVCPVCFWEDDVLLTDEEDITSPANSGMSVAEAQANYIRLGACAPAFVEKVRPPRPDEPIDPAWRPLSNAHELKKGKSKAKPALAAKK